MANPINKTNSAYPGYHHVVFPPVLSANANGNATPIPRNTFGDISLPTFNKITAGKLPSAAVTIRNLIRGNSS